jgi:hypothetical protein
MQCNSLYMIWYEFIMCDVGVEKYTAHRVQILHMYLVLILNCYIKKFPFYFSKAGHSPITFFSFAIILQPKMLKPIK